MQRDRIKDLKKQEALSRERGARGQRGKSDRENKKRKSATRPVAGSAST